LPQRRCDLILNILLIITPYHPAQTPNTLRWQPLVAEFVRRGHQVSILTTKRRGYSDIDSDVIVHRAGYHTLQDRVYEWGPKQSRRHEVGSAPPKSGLKQFILQSIANRFWRKRYWPDGSALFLKPGIKRGKSLLSSNNFSHIISVGLPFTSHLIAHALKRHQPDLHWHMDIQDPFCYSREFRVNNYSRYKEKNIKAEAEAFESADTISITNDKAKNKYIDLFPKQRHKISVIPPLWYRSEAEETYDMILFSQKKHLGYFGSFYENVRSPKPFLELLSYMHTQDAKLMDRVQFHFIGQMDRVSMEIIQRFPELSSYFVFHGFKNRAETISAMEQVDILLNFGNSTDYHLPSKVVDYLAINKPILNLATIAEDSTAIFFSDKNRSFKSILLSSETKAINMTAFYDFVFAETTTSDAYENMDDFELEAIGHGYIAQLTIS